MIISDLNQLEVVEEASVVGGFAPSEYGNVVFTESFYVNKYLSSGVNVYGHLATSESNANASGYGTATQTFTNASTTPYSSSSNGTSIAATSGSYYYPYYR
jgi:hypothetical protein